MYCSVVFFTLFFRDVDQNSDRLKDQESRVEFIVDFFFIIIKMSKI